MAEDLARMAETLLEERRLGWEKRDISYFAPGQEGQTVAAHSYFVAQATLFLATLAGEKVDLYRTVLMALFQASTNTRTGERPRTHMRYVSLDIQKALEEKYRGWEPGDLIAGLVSEAKEGKTYAAKLAQDANVIAGILVDIKIMERLGVQGVAERFAKNMERLATPEGKALAAQLKETDYMDWWNKARWGK